MLRTSEQELIRFSLAIRGTLACHPTTGGIQEEIAMKTALLFVAALAVASLSLGAASAERISAPQDNYKCSTTTWPVISATQCNKPLAHNYVECVKMVTDKGWRSSDAWWGCSNQGFKN
jgi:hypothetical protein